MERDEKTELTSVEETPTTEGTLTETPTLEETTYKKTEVDTLIKTALEDEYKKFNKSQTRLGEENKKLREQIDRLSQVPKTASPSSDDKVYELLLQDKKRKASELGESDPMISVLEQELSERRQRRTREAYESQMHQQEQRRTNEHEKIRRQIVDAGLDPEDDMFDSVYNSVDIAYAIATGADSFADGVKKAYTKLERVMSKVKPESTETKPSRIEELETELKRLKLENEGKLKSDKGIPAGEVLSFQQFEEQYIKGKVLKADYEKRARREGKL